MSNELKVRELNIIERNTINISLDTHAFEKILENVMIKNIENLQILIRKELLILKGDTKIKVIGISTSVHFELFLKPIKTKERTVYFELKDAKPFLLDFFPSIAFKKIPIVSYENRIIQVNLEKLDLIKSIPFGFIKEMFIQDGQFILTIGL